jgi:hypothetical protein
MSLQAIMDALAQSGGGNPTIADLAQNRKGVQIPDREGLKQAAYGVPSGLVGMPGDIESLGRMFLSENQETVFPTSTEVGDFLGADTNSMGFDAGTLVSPDPFGKFMAAASLLAIPAKKIRKFMPKDFSAGKVAKGNSTKTNKKKFATAQNQARDAMSETDRAQVDAFDPEFDGQVFLTPDGDAGFSMTPDGYVGHVFKHPESGGSGTIDAVMTKARGEGATSLDAFDTYLPDAYKKTGARETGRNAWDPEYATEEIVKAFGEQKPDFVGMEIGGVFPEYKHSQIIGPRPQTSLPRYTETPTGKPVKKPASIDKMINPAGKEKFQANVKKGMEEGAEKWYHLGGVADKYIEEHGVVEGIKKFDDYMDISSAMSPRSSVAQEIKRASVVQYRMKRGLPVKDLDADMFPDKYGHLATTTAHRNLLNQWLETGQVGNSKNPLKAPAYAQNKKLNYAPYTSDTHDFGNLSGTKRGPTKQEYPYVENAQSEWAAEMGLQPAEGQSAKWVGIKEESGIADARNYTAALNQRIAKTAAETGQTEEEVMKLFLNRDIILKAIMGGLGTGVVGGAMFEGAGQDEGKIFQ